MTAAQPSLDALIEKHRPTIEETVKARDGWEPGSYTINPLGHWNHEVLPILAVNTTKIKTGYAPLFVVLPNDRLVSTYQAGILEAIVVARFAAPKPNEAEVLARLAARFGRFENDVGDFTLDFPIGKPAGAPRPDAKPVYTADKNSHRISFYTFNYERMRLFDCTLIITSGKVSLESRFVPGE